MRQLRKQKMTRDADGEVQVDTFDDAFEVLGLDLPDNVRRSVPSLANVATFLVQNNAFGMDEDAFTRRLEEDYD